MDIDNENNEEIDYMSMELIEKANDFDKEYKIQKEILRNKKKKMNNKESSSESDDEIPKVLYKIIYNKYIY
jgi:hypothetical protein